MDTKNIITIEKGSVGTLNCANDSGNELYRGDPGHSSAALPVRAYAHHPTPQAKPVGNPAPIGLFAAASTIFIVSANSTLAHGASIPSALLSVVSFVGGSVHFLVGVWTFAGGDTFSSSVFFSYGSFWFAYGSFLFPGLGIAEAYAGNMGDLGNILGIFLAVWFILTFIYLLGALRTNLATVLVFFFLDLTFFFLMISEFTGSVGVHKAGGWFGIFTSAAAFYAGAAQLLTKDNFFFALPVGPFHPPN